MKEEEDEVEGLEEYGDEDKAARRRRRVAVAVASAFHETLILHLFIRANERAEVSSCPCSSFSRIDLPLEYLKSRNLWKERRQ